MVNTQEKCVKCANYVTSEGFEIPSVLSDDGLECKMPLEVEFNFCKEIGDYKGITSCIACQENHYPINFVSNTRICISTDEWSLQPDPLIDSLPNCQIWDHSTKECTKCLNDMWIENGKCKT